VSTEPPNFSLSAELITELTVPQVCRRFFLEYTYPTMPSWSYVSRALVALPLVGQSSAGETESSSALTSRFFAGSFHGSDILNVFGLSPLNPTTEFQTRWIAFANTMNRGLLPSFPPPAEQNGRLTRFSNSQRQGLHLLAYMYVFLSRKIDLL
jgi:hypothetical protein